MLYFLAMLWTQCLYMSGQEGILIYEWHSLVFSISRYSSTLHIWRSILFRRHIYHMSWHYFHWLLVLQFWLISWVSCVAIFIIILKMSFLILKVVLGKWCNFSFWYKLFTGLFRILVTPDFMKRLFDPVREERVAPNEAGNGPGGFDWGDNDQ